MTREEVDAAIHALVFETLGIRRYVQDGPIRPDVLINYIKLALAGKLDQRVSLILTPKRTAALDGRQSAAPGAVAQTLLDRMLNAGDAATLTPKVPEASKDGSPIAEGVQPDSRSEEIIREKEIIRETALAISTRYLVVDLTFHELVKFALPMTDWWLNNIAMFKSNDGQNIIELLSDVANKEKDTSKFRKTSQYRLLIILALIFDMHASWVGTTRNLNGRNKKSRVRAINARIKKYTQIMLAIARKTESHKADAMDKFNYWDEKSQELLIIQSDHYANDEKNIILRLHAIMEGRSTSNSTNDIKPYFKWNGSTNWWDPRTSTKDKTQEDADYANIWSIDQNRITMQPTANTSINKVSPSRDTIKADAAIRLFNISTKHLTWAIIDTGIDEKHPAFRDWDLAKIIKPKNKGKKEFEDEKGLKDSSTQKTVDLPSRVVRALDFTRLRRIQCGQLNTEALKEMIPETYHENIDHVRKIICRDKKYTYSGGTELSWRQIEPLLRVWPSTKRVETRDNTAFGSHGTHVAGILAGYIPDDPPPSADDDPPPSADDSLQPFAGVCPDIRLYDLRVFDSANSISGDEFTVLAALDYISWLNRDPELPIIHGVNISLSLRHQVDAHACGRTPICEAANRLVYSGAVVVAAAGNAGFEQHADRFHLGSGYRNISITDPGNAEEVICVGATHRSDPHTYGVSFFSSRGPTGDGRAKPDLVAPGEKIYSSIASGGFAFKDGTSMAAPHVSGVCALLMARHKELIGEPAKIKAILMRTATDLGREKYFQGAGLVDALRAIQSV